MPRWLVNPASPLSDRALTPLANGANVAHNSMLDNRFCVAAREVTGREFPECHRSVHIVGDDALLQADNGTSNCVPVQIGRSSRMDLLARFSRRSHETLVTHGTAATKPGFGNAMRRLVEFDMTVPTTQDFFILI